MLDAVDKPPHGQLVRLARWYTTEVDHFNEKLDQLLSDDESMNPNVAERRPMVGGQLLDVQALLLFDRVDEWKQLVAEKDLSDWREVQRDKVEQLRDLLEADAGLETLIDRYRLLVLGDGPGFAKHAVLLQLSRLDSETWARDLLEFEQHRFKILAGKNKKASEQFDSELMDEILYEIDHTQWQSPLPMALAEIAERHSEQEYKEQIEFRLNELAKELLSHFEARDWENANRLKNQWKELYAEAEQATKARITTEVEDALSWAYADSRKSALTTWTPIIVFWLAMSGLVFVVVSLLLWLF